jgi:3'-phosphoadenosine 5'-phosphosulfate sulfotransferase (PAPS reductase)/FAD synthetase
MNESVALERIRKALNKFGTSLYLGHSGGKDSAVIYHLATKVYFDITVVHNPKPDVHSDTILYLYELAQNRPVHFVPSVKMPQTISLYGWRCQIDGTRIAEYTRTDRSTDLIVDGQSVSRETMTESVDAGIYGLSMLYPIYDWTDEEVWEYIKLSNIPVSKEYDNV